MERREVCSSCFRWGHQSLEVWSTLLKATQVLCHRSRLSSWVYSHQWPYKSSTLRIMHTSLYSELGKLERKAAVDERMGIVKTVPENDISRKLIVKWKLTAGGWAWWPLREPPELRPVLWSVELMPPRVKGSLCIHHGLISDEVIVCWWTKIPNFTEHLLSLSHNFTSHIKLKIHLRAFVCSWSYTLLCAAKILVCCWKNQ